jgi:hypothetical protein
VRECHVSTATYHVMYPGIQHTILCTTYNVMYDMLCTLSTTYHAMYDICKSIMLHTTHDVMYDYHVMYDRVVPQDVVDEATQKEYKTSDSDSELILA